MAGKTQKFSAKTHSTTKSPTEKNVRRSPRRSSSPSKIEDSAVKPCGKNRKSKSEELALSLYVIEDEDGEVFVPLKIFDPNLSGEKFRRRSPRFTGNECTSVGKQNADSIDLIPALYEQKCLRRSPRFTGNECTSVKQIADSASAEHKCMRRSPRFTGNECTSVKQIADSASAEHKCKRRSPRFTKNESIDVHSSSAKHECLPRFTKNECRSVSKQIVDSVDLKSPLTAEHNCVRRSPRLSSALVVSQSDARDVKLVKSELALIEWSDLSDKRQSSKKKSPSSMGETGATVVGEKRLRSRMIPGSVIGAAWCDSEDERSSKKVKTTPGKSDVERKHEKCLRKSPRHSSSSVGAKNATMKSDLLALSEPKSEKINRNTFGERSLRSRKVPFCLVGTKNEEVKSALKELPEALVDNGAPEIIKNDSESCDFDVLGEKCLKFQTPPSPSETKKEVVSMDDEAPEKINTTFGSRDLDTSGEKCLRSRKIPFRLVGTENVEGKLELIASPEEKQKEQKNKASFIGEPVPKEEARERWRWRYELKGLQSQQSKGQSWKLNADEEDEIILNVECHFTQAKVDGCIYNLGDCAYIKGDGRQKYVGRIIEFFKTVEGDDYFRVQWFYRAQDTVMKEAAAFHDKRRLFYSTVMNDNLLDCIISKVGVKQIRPTLGLNLNSIPPSDFYYDMEYCVEYSTFRTLLNDNSVESHDSASPNYVETSHTTINTTSLEDTPSCELYKAELGLLDLYSGCGGMSTGLCLGAKLSHVNLVTRWAVDYDSFACDSLKLNHPETQVRNESAEDFLELLKGWKKLCNQYVFNDLERALQSGATDTREAKDETNRPSDLKIPAGEYEVSCVVDICYGDPSNSGKRGLKFKVRWKGYSSSEDTWEPVQSLSNCEERVRDFVRSGFQSKLLPLPGGVDVICGGPPCQGISGYNRFRNVDAPLDDERNRQIIVFMDIVKFLKPKYVLMENVSDILRFNKASLGRYALSRLVHMKYQARLGTIAAGCYGLPQFRLRVFLWGALPSEKLPQFPLPTHDVVVRYWPPPEFERNTVAYDEDQPRQLEEAVILRDAISDLPAVTSHETREEMTYQMPPETEFQKYIRLTKYATFTKVDKDIATRMRWNS
ncbi:DNA (cytosine-5)-methyltransferase CMT2-like isoform X2 [Cornus florida]|uniref:DNA (cytosine-5)-methyltransferase CMT2-like isoform X2 n=1 Tax=Cornus florida TaxID=4283 RepID=UPI0028A1B095|nr:DNA (cytosine-5)-methyltransferase CMT2-like isoform X2 [Cornus florida]